MKKDESDYGFENWVPIKLFPDLIPVVGAVTWSERERRYRRLSVRGFYLSGLRDIDSWISCGTSEWPAPSDRKALIRSVLLAGRNVSFAAYHAFSPLIIASFLQGK